MNYYGSEFPINLLSEDKTEQLKKDIPVTCTVTLSQRQLCDLEMIMNGAMNPLSGFMNEADYRSVLENMALENGLLWSLPITLDVSKEQLDAFNNATQIGLCDEEGFMLAVIEIQSTWKVDKKQEAEKIYGTTDVTHPGVQYLESDVKE